MLSAALIIIYFIIRFGFTRQLDALGEYASYLFEAFFVVIAAVYYRKKIKIKFYFIDSLKLDFLPPLFFGAIIFLLTKPLLQTTVPFDLRSKETILFLLLIGPVLEEMIFRFALWEMVVDLCKKFSKLSILMVTSLIFSYAHFHAYWFVPDQIHPFIFYQTIYTFGLALYCGLRRVKYNSMVQPMIVHLAFNFGFFLASFL